MAWILGGIGLLVIMTIALRALLGAAGSGGGDEPDPGGDEQTGIEAFTVFGTSNVTAQRGTEFTANQAITVTKLTFYGREASFPHTVTLRLWRVSDSTLLGSVNIDVPANAGPDWIEGELSSPVALSQGADYVVTARRSDGNSYVARSANLDTVTFADEITFVRSRQQSTDAMPSTANASTTQLLSLVDIIFTT